MADVATARRDDFIHSFRAAADDVAEGLTASRTASADTHWAQWHTFCVRVALDPLLVSYRDPVPILNTFAREYRTGRISASGAAVRSRTVEDAVRSVGQTLAALGARDPRLTDGGDVDIRLRLQYRAYSKQDPPPRRVKPIPVQVIHRIARVAMASRNEELMAISDMITIAYFFLLRPGEYTSSRTTTPFSLQDVGLYCGGQRFEVLTSSIHAIRSSTNSSLEFTTQKNAVRGEVIAHGASTDPVVCPTAALVRRVLHLRHAGAAPNRLLAAYHNGRSWGCVTPSDISDALRGAVRHLGPTLGFLPSDVSARSLRAAGAMALLCSGVDTDMIKLIGRWRSDEMLRYLHVQARPVMQGFARQMLLAGDYTLHPNRAAAGTDSQITGLIEDGGLVPLY